jgi:hypothetical protein
MVPFEASPRAFGGFSAVTGLTAELIIHRLICETSLKEIHNMKYEYKVLPFIGKLKSGLFGSVQDAGEVSTQLASVINQHASQGWEFIALNDVNIEIKPGCLAGLFGNKTAFIPFDQVIFRRPAGEMPPAIPTA